MTYPFFPLYLQINKTRALACIMRIYFFYILIILFSTSFISCNEDYSYIRFDDISNIQKKEAKQQRGKKHANIEYNQGEVAGRPSSENPEYEISVDIKGDQLVIEIGEELKDAQIVIMDKEKIIVYQETDIYILEKKVIIIDSANSFPYYLFITDGNKEINGKIISYWVDEDDEE